MLVTLFNWGLSSLWFERMVLNVKPKQNEIDNARMMNDIRFMLIFFIKVNT